MTKPETEISGLFASDKDAARSPHFLPSSGWVGEAGKVLGETVWSFQLKGKTEVERKRSVGRGVEFFENCRCRSKKQFARKKLDASVRKVVVVYHD